MIRLFIFVTAWALAPCALGAFQVPGYELVYSYPVETTLEEPDLRRALDVWPEMFDRARKTIDVNQFYITPAEGEPLEKSLKALERAAKRGVRIRFLLEKKFEKNSTEGIARLKTIPNLELRILEWSSVQGSGIIHAKYFLVDSTAAYVGSQNFDWRSLKHIHELGLRIADTPTVRQLASVFERDWALAASTAAAPALTARPQPDYSRSSYLIASPWRLNPESVGDSEAELARLIGAAKIEVLVQVMEYAPYTYSKPRRFYSPIDNALRDAAVRGVKVKLLVSHWNTEKPAIDHLKSLSLLPNIEVKIITIPEAKQGPIPFSRVAHSKYMVVDGSALWLGTSNWMGGYLDDSRNVELVVKNTELSRRAAALHQRLWDCAYSEPVDMQKTYPSPRR